MFTKSTDPPTDVDTAPPSLINAGLHIKGNLTSDGDVQIEGVVEGDVKSRSVTISENGSVKGEIVSDALQINGSVTGQIKARSVTLSRTGRVTGDILYESLSVEVGAYVEGYCRRITESDRGKPAIDSREPKVSDTAKESFKKGDGKDTAVAAAAKGDAQSEKSF